MKPVAQAAVGQVFLQPRGEASTTAAPLLAEQLTHWKWLHPPSTLLLFLYSAHQLTHGG